MLATLAFNDKSVIMRSGRPGSKDDAQHTKHTRTRAILLLARARTRETRHQQLARDIDTDVHTRKARTHAHVGHLSPQSGTLRRETAETTNSTTLARLGDGALCAAQPHTTAQRD